MYVPKMLHAKFLKTLRSIIIKTICMTIQSRHQTALKSQCRCAYIFMYFHHSIVAYLDNTSIHGNMNGLRLISTKMIISWFKYAFVLRFGSSSCEVEWHVDDLRIWKIKNVCIFVVDTSMCFVRYEINIRNTSWYVNIIVCAHIARNQ